MAGQLKTLSHDKCTLRAHKTGHDSLTNQQKLLIPVFWTFPSLMLLYWVLKGPKNILQDCELKIVFKKKTFQFVSVFFVIVSAVFLFLQKIMNNCGSLQCILLVQAFLLALCHLSYWSTCSTDSNSNFSSFLQFSVKLPNEQIIEQKTPQKKKFSVLLLIRTSIFWTRNSFSISKSIIFN